MLRLIRCVICLDVAPFLSLFKRSFGLLFSARISSICGILMTVNLRGIFLLFRRRCRAMQMANAHKSPSLNGHFIESSDGSIRKRNPSH